MGSVNKGGVDMGRGDARTRRGKIFRGSHGNARPKDKNKKTTTPTPAPTTTAPTTIEPTQPPVEEETPVAEA
jgi:ribosomal small subunit protein bTHX